MEPYFDVWILGKLDDDRDVFMDLVIFCTREIESVSDQGEGAMNIFLPPALHSRNMSSGSKPMSSCLIPYHFLYRTCKENISPGENFL
jgi:hypothetical protein